MAENPKIEWCLVLKLADPITGVKCYCCNYQSRSCYNVQTGEAGKRIISLYLENCEADEEPVALNIAFSILNATNDEVFTRISEFSGIISNAKSFGFNRFISETEICPTLLVKGSLIIFCEVIMFGDANSRYLSLLTRFDAFINTENYSDVTLCLGDEKIPAHKVILASKSPVFDKMFSTDMSESRSNEAKVPNDIRLEVFNELLKFIYTGQVEKLEELALEIFKAAHFYQIEDLKLICEHVLRKTFKIENAINVLILAENYDAECLKEHCVAFILKNFKMVMKTAAFKDLHKTHPHLPSELLIEMGSRLLK